MWGTHKSLLQHLYPEKTIVKPMTSWVGFYLLFAVLMADGKPAPTEAVPFASQEDCTREGLIRSNEKLRQSDIKDVLWSCISVDFSPADQLPQNRPPADRAPLPKNGAA